MIILALYVNNTYTWEYIDVILKSIKDITKSFNNDVKIITMITKNIERDMDLECIYPKYVISEDVSKEFEENIESLKTIILNEIKLE